MILTYNNNDIFGLKTSVLYQLNNISMYIKYMIQRFIRNVYYILVIFFIRFYFLLKINVLITASNLQNFSFERQVQQIYGVALWGITMETYRMLYS